MDEIERVRSVYASYAGSGREARWDDDLSMHAERAELFAQSITRALGSRLGSARTLEVGCGRGRIRGELIAAGIADDHLVGIDVDLDRLRSAREDGTRAAAASGASLPFPDDSFDLIVCATVLSSIHDRDVLAGIVTEAERVLRPGGVLLVYDMRLPSPGNRTIVPLTARRARALFRGWSHERRSCTLLPPLARALAPTPGPRYSALAAVPFLRSHALLVLRPPTTSEPAARPVVGFVGPMVGRHPGRVTTQGEILADLFTTEGWTVRETSTRPGRLVRLGDTVVALVSWRRQVDVAVVSVFSGPAFVMADVSSLIARRLGFAVVLWLHGGNLGPFSRRHPRWTARVLARADHMVAPSAFLADEVEGIAEPSEIIPNVVDVDLVGDRTRPDLRPRLLWMRTFHPIYNPLMAVRAASIVHADHPGVVLTMAGQAKGSEGDVAAAVRAGGLDDVVALPGFLDRAGKAAAFRDHDIYLHTNDVDNMPVSVLEAASAGLPIVATRVGGIPYMLEHERTALLVEPGDAEAMAAAVDRLLGDPELARRLSTAGRQLAERSSWPAVRLRWEGAFASAQAARDGRRRAR